MRSLRLARWCFCFAIVVAVVLGAHVPGRLLVRMAAAETTNPHGELTIDCAVCHTAKSWAVGTEIEGFDHGEVAQYPLTQAHTAVPCRSCHGDLVFRNANADCVTCHDDVHHGDLGDRCSRCHTPDTWSAMDAAISEHSSTDFPLLGLHATAPCASCHPSALAGAFRDASTECSGCHLDEFVQTTDPDHVDAGFPDDCASCHATTASAWTPAEFEHPSTFPLEGGHAAPACADCHQSTFTETSTECSECHLSDLEGAEPSHEGFPPDCTTCHTVTAWDPADFDHDDSYPLLGAHQEVACLDCHGSGYAGTPTECLDCHRGDLEGADPNHEGFPPDCTTCHALTAWEPAAFDHDAIFPLEGAHQDVACADCHTTGYESTPNLCSECHRSDYENVDDPDHVAGAFPDDCTTCHSLLAWRPADFEHPSTFPLEQGHADVACTSCHADGYDDAPTECAACHLADAEGATPTHDGLGTECTSCHTLSAWQPANFEHPQSFELELGHEAVDCASCHTAGYEGTPTECVDCHRTDADGAEPDHVAGGFPDDCTTCHSLAAWQPAAFDHTPSFPLTQGHADLVCASCHSGGFEGTPTECADCHLADSEAAAPSHDGLPTDCTTCHSTATWQPSSFAHPTSFPLTEGHEAVDCASCHTAGYEGTPTECVDCHLADSEAAAPSHDGLPTDCTTCHSTATWQPSNFAHPPSFPLTEGHEAVDCASCHTAGYEGTPTECVDCHLADFESAEPDHDGAGFPLDCLTCHSLAAWQPASFDHTPTFPLTEGHADLTCVSCHSAGYEGTPTECVDCHLADSEAAVPSHDGLPTDCTTCHSISGWIPSSFDHSTSFPLTEGHEAVDCASCHSAGYEDTSTECVDCHLADYDGAEPDHVAGAFPEDCTTCHSLSDWTPASFNHTPSFPLIGGHDDLACTDCHSGGYEDTPSECIDCHLTDSQGAEPSHDGLPRNCATCHNLQGWSPSSFRHPSSFPLTEGHEDVDCASCHTAGYEGTPTECVDCHLADFQGAEPDHVEGGFPEDCTTCHSLSGWIPADFAHTTTFPLTGGHGGLACASCHAAGYESTPTECVDCHLADAEGAVPTHDGLPTECTTCHTIQGWVPSSFVHTSSFPLTEGHDGVACASCHNAGYEGTPTECIDCHLADFQGAEPSHDGFPEDCVTCHSMSGWTPAEFEHTSEFPLTDGHDGLACADCHAAGYENTPSECIECHLADFLNADPDHVGGGFPEDCTTCHTIQGWSPADFAHTTTFPLTGGHDGLACADCHSAGYENTSPECIECHLSEYQTASPDHDGAGFPQNCTSCHTIQGWDPADFNHDGDWFRIYSGSHREAWNTCTDCHANPNDFTMFSCIDCHEHRQSRMDDKHNEVNGYSYDSDACYSCHPDGSD